MNSYMTYLGSILVIITGVVFYVGKPHHIKNLIGKVSFNQIANSASVPSLNIFTADQLQKYNGRDDARLYIAVLGNIFDVSKGKQHYMEGAPYNYFVGKDGSRSLVTGDFTDETIDKDSVLDMHCNDLIQVLNWVDVFKTKYDYKGILIGRYYDANGEATKYKKLTDERLNTCNMQILKENEFKQKYPPCNVEWSINTGSKVWCTQDSGGINRHWIGVPRKLYVPGDESTKCICVNINDDNSETLLKEYDNCPSTSTYCHINE